MKHCHRTNIVRKSQKDLTLFENCAMRTVPADHELFPRLCALAHRGYVERAQVEQLYSFTLTGSGKFALGNILIVKQLTGA